MFFTNQECKLIRLMNVAERIIVGQNLETIYFHLALVQGKSREEGGGRIRLEIVLVLLI